MNKDQILSADNELEEQYDKVVDKAEKEGTTDDQPMVGIKDIVEACKESFNSGYSSFKTGRTTEQQSNNTDVKTTETTSSSCSIPRES